MNDGREEGGPPIFLWCDVRGALSSVLLPLLSFHRISTSLSLVPPLHTNSLLLLAVDVVVGDEQTLS